MAVTVDPHAGDPKRLLTAWGTGNRLAMLGGQEESPSRQTLQGHGQRNGHLVTWQ